MDGLVVTSTACRSPSITKSSNSLSAALNGRTKEPVRSSSRSQGDRQRAVALSEPFMKDVIANLDNDWQINAEQIDSFLRSRRA